MHVEYISALPTLPHETVFTEGHSQVLVKKPHWLMLPARALWVHVGDASPSKLLFRSLPPSLLLYSNNAQDRGGR